MRLSELQVLDHGFVRVVDYMGTDKRVVDTARLSYHKTEFEEPFNAKDERLVNFLAEHQHTTPFRHCMVSLLIKAPEFVMRQWYKHAVGASWQTEGSSDTPWNEMSQRFKEVPLEFYTPKRFKAQDLVNKQSAGAPLGAAAQGNCEDAYNSTLRAVRKAYTSLLEEGVAREQARLILPLSVYTTAQWTVSLQALAHFVKLRKAGDAQAEICEYATAIEKLVAQLFPVSWKALLGENNGPTP